MIAAIGTLRGTGLLRGLGRTLAAAAVMTLAVWVIYTSLGLVLPSGRRISSAAEVGVPVLAGAALYLGVAALLKSDELQLLIDVIRRPMSPRSSA
jgi:voltage-gated potassium channel Kch